MPAVIGLGHIGIYVTDLERMVSFYRDFMGMQVTKQNWDLGGVFLSADPARADHEVALIKGRPSTEDPHLIQQISFQVETLDELREFHRLVRKEGLALDGVVSHGSAIGVYFFDPEGNRTEVFWLTGRPCWAITVEGIDIERPDDEVMADVDRVWEPLRHIPMGGKP